MADLETQEALETLTQVVGILSELIDRSSRWGGALELTESLFTSGVAHMDGRIEITRAVWRQPRYGVSRSIAGVQSFTRRCTSIHRHTQATNMLPRMAGKKA